MPAGVSWPTYLKFFVAAGLSMFAGSHTVHTFYRPLDDMEAWFQRFEAEERRQRMIAQAMKEQKDAVQAAEGGAAMVGDQGNEKAVKQGVEGKVDQAVA